MFDMESPLVVAVTAIEADLDKALSAAEELWRCPNDQLGDLAKRTGRLLARVQALHLKTVAEVEARGLAQADGSLHTANWIRHTLHRTPAEAKATVTMATATAPGAPHGAVGEALAAGELDWEAARVIVRALDVLPDSLDAATLQACRTAMLDAARDHDANGLRELGRAIRHRVDPDGSLADEKEVAKVRGATYRVHGDGTHSLVWRDSIEAIAHAKAAIAALDAPAPAEDGTLDPRSAAQRRADALIEIFARILRHGDLPTSRGRAPHLIVTVGIDTLKGQSDAALAALATGSALSAEAVRRLACDADITAIVLDTTGVPLSVGRTYRTVTQGIWTALVARDGGCVFHGCSAPPGHCRAHHLKHWADHGETSLENCALVCERHHVMIHHRGWDLRMSEDGHPELIPPTWVDAQQQPRRNQYWRLQRELMHPPDLNRDE